MQDRDDIRDRFSPLLDGELSPEDRSAVEAALSDDAELLRELDSFKRVDDLYRALPPIAAPDGFEDIVRERTHPRLVAAAAAAVPPLQRARERRRRVWPAMAAAAAIVVCVGGVMLTMDRANETVRVALSSPLPSMKADEAAPAPAPLAAPASEPAPESSAQRSSRVADTHDKSSMSPDGAAVERGAAGGYADGVPQRGIMKQQQAKQSELAEFSVSNHAETQVPDEAKEAPSKAAASKVENLGHSRIRDSVKTSGAQPSKDAKRPAPEAAATKEAGPGDAAGVVPNAPPAAMPVPAVSPATSPPPPLVDAPEATAPPAAPAATAPPPKDNEVQATTTQSQVHGIAMGGPPSREIGARRLSLRDGVWYQSGYDAQPATAIARDSAAAHELIKKDPDLKGIFKIKEPVVFSVADTWYQIAARP